MQKRNGQAVPSQPHDSHFTPGVDLHFEIGPGATRDALVRLGCAVAILDDEGRVLLHRRTDGDWWALPGGGLEPGETFTAAVIREACEETGLEIEIIRLLGLYTDPTICVIYPDGDRVQVAAVVFVAHATGGQMITANAETAELRWFEPAEIPTNLIPTHRRRVADLFDPNHFLRVD